MNSSSIDVPPIPPHHHPASHPTPPPTHPSSTQPSTPWVTLHRRHHHPPNPTAVANVADIATRTATMQPQPPRQEETETLFQRCRDDNWRSVLMSVKENPWIALTPMVMDNHISTTIIHQAITSKADTAIRAEVISTILKSTPRAAAIKNGYGSLPLHVIAQRNVKMDAQTKERLIFEMVPCYPEALTEQGGVGKRTPLHIIFTDYISPRLTRMMIENGSDACFMKDKKGFLPAHVACMRHCSPEKLRMLLAVNHNALYEKTNDQQTLLDLASHKATKAHPNYALIDELNKQLAGDMSHYDPVVLTTPKQASTNGHHHHPNGSNTARSIQRPVAVSAAMYQYNNNNSHYTHNHHYMNAAPIGPEYRYRHSPPQSQQPYQHQYDHHHHIANRPMFQYQYQHQHIPNTIGRVSSEDEEGDVWNRNRLDSNETWASPTQQPEAQSPYHCHQRPYAHQGGSNDESAMMRGMSTNLDVRIKREHESGLSQHTTPSPLNPYSTQNESDVPPHLVTRTATTKFKREPSSDRRKRKSSSVVSTKSPDPAAHLLLHFSRNSNTGDDIASTEGDYDDQPNTFQQRQLMRDFPTSDSSSTRHRYQSSASYHPTSSGGNNKRYIVTNHLPSSTDLGAVTSQVAEV